MNVCRKNKNRSQAPNKKARPKSVLIASWLNDHSDFPPPVYLHLTQADSGYTQGWIFKFRRDGIQIFNIQ
jgi:hypothetical protein